MATIAEKLQTILDAKNDIKAAMKERDLEGNYEPVNDDITGYGDKIRNAYSDVDGMMYAGASLKKFPSTFKFAPRKHWGLKWENIAEDITNKEKRSEITEQYFGWINGEQDGSLLKSEYGDKIIEYLYIMWGDDWFYGHNLFSLNWFLDTLPDIDTSDLDVFDYMFFNCNSLKSVKGLNTHNGRSFTNMLSYCPVETIQDLDMSNALFVDSMYQGTKMSHISGLTLPQVVTASRMFCDCHDLIDARDINMPNVIDAEELFMGCENLTSVSNLNIQNAKRIGSMFNECSKLESIPKMNVPNATAAGSMFFLCQNLTTVSGLDMPKVTDASYMFSYCTGLTTVSGLDMPNLTNTSRMFYACSALTLVDGLDLTNTGKDNTFDTCKNMVLSNIKAPKDKSVMSFVFYHTSGITIKNWVINSGITDISGMFSGLTGIEKVDGVDFSNATDASYMFSGCTGLTTVSGLDMPNVTNASRMFSCCSELTTVSGLTIPKVTDAREMFDGCFNLTTITNFSGLKVSIDFSICTELTHDSIMVVINGLETVTSQKLRLGTTNLAKLTDDEKKIATDKGWTLK